MLSAKRGVSSVSVVLLLALALGSCGNPRVGNAGGSSSRTEASRVVPPRLPTLPRRSLEIRQEVAASYERWAGSDDDNRMLNVLVAYYQNGEYASCMSDAGYPGYRWEDMIAPISPWPPLAQTTWLRDPLRNGDVQSMIDEAHSLEVERRAHADGATGDEAAAQLKCREEVGLPDPDHAPEVPGIDRLRRDWTDALRAVVWPITGDSNMFAICVADKAILPGDRRLTQGDYYSMVESRDRIYEELAPPDGARASAWDPSGGHVPLTADWDPVLQANYAYLQAAWACAEPVYEAGIDAVQPVVVEFEAQHRDQIAEAEAFWVEVRRRAVELGYRPEDPYLTETD